MDTERLVIGVIRGSHGLEGNVKVESTSGEVDHFFDLTEVTLKKDGHEKTYTVEDVAGSTANLLMKFKGIDSPEDTAKIRGSEIIVPRSMACPCDKDEYYVEDLKQCTLVYKASGKENGLKLEKSAVMECGTITDVLEGGAGHLLEVVVSESLQSALNSTDETSTSEKTGDGKKRTVLVPFQKEFIGTVDLKRHTVQLMHLWVLE